MVHFFVLVGGGDGVLELVDLELGLAELAGGVFCGLLGGGDGFFEDGDVTLEVGAEGGVF